MSELNVQAVNTKVIVKLFKPRPIETGGKIILPESSPGKVKPQFYGEVISIGEDIKTIEVGDTIFFHANAGQDMVLENVVCKVMNYEEIYGIESRKVDKKEEAKEDDFLLVLPQIPESKIITPGQGTNTIQ